MSPLRPKWDVFAVSRRRRARRAVRDCRCFHLASHGSVVRGRSWAAAPAAAKTRPARILLDSVGTNIW